MPGLCRTGYAGLEEGRLTQGFPGGNGWVTVGDSCTFAPFVGPLARVPNLVRLICLLQEGPSPGLLLCGVAKPRKDVPVSNSLGRPFCSIFQDARRGLLRPAMPGPQLRMPQLLALRPGLTLGLADSQWEGCHYAPCVIMHVLCQ